MTVVSEVYNSVFNTLESNYKLGSSKNTVESSGKEIAYYIEYEKGTETSVTIQFLNGFEETKLFKSKDVDEIVLTESINLSLKIKAHPINTLKVKCDGTTNQNTFLSVKAAFN